MSDKHKFTWPPQRKLALSLLKKKKKGNLRPLPASPQQLKFYCTICSFVCQISLIFASFVISHQVVFITVLKCCYNVYSGQSGLVMFCCFYKNQSHAMQKSQLSLLLNSSSLVSLNWAAIRWGPWFSYLDICKGIKNQIKDSAPVSATAEWVLTVGKWILCAREKTKAW